MSNTKLLNELGYKVDRINQTDKKGNEWVYRVTSKPVTYYVRKIRSGELRAFRSKNSTSDTTISGLYHFIENEGNLVGSTPSPKIVVTRKKMVQSAA